MSCEHIEDHEQTSTAKDREIAELKLRLAAQTVDRPSSPISSPVIGVPKITRQLRRGKASPIEMFSGENIGICLDDWLPSLQRVANWNNWMEDEQLIQFAGHLKGRTLAEWNILSPDEITTVEVA